MATTDPVQQFLQAAWNQFKTDLLTDFQADVWPDVQNVFNMVASGGLQSLLLPTNGAQLLALEAKLEADALTMGNDLSKQGATFLLNYFKAKFAAPAATAARA